MYLSAPKPRGLGQDVTSGTDLLTELSTPVPLVGLSPLWIAGLGLLALAVITSFGGKQVSRMRRSVAKRKRRKLQIQALESQLKQLKAS